MKNKPIIFVFIAMLLILSNIPAFGQETENRAEIPATATENMPEAATPVLENRIEPVITNESESPRTLQFQPIAPFAIGDTIAQTFPDPKLAQLIAKNYASGNVNTVLTQPLIDSITTIIGGNQGITDLTGIGYLTELQSIILNNNSIASIPSEIGNLDNLNILSLTSNQLTDLPSEISQLSSLTSLYLDFNKIEDFPIAITDLTSLINLEMNNNQLTTLPPEIGNLEQIELLVFNQNQLTEIPSEIGNLSNLIKLSFYKNQLSSLSLEIGNLSALDFLDVGSNQLTQLPQEIGKLTSLTIFYADDNQLTTLPIEIGDLSNLNNLNLEFNQLSSLPTQIGNLDNLIRLFLSSNQLAVLPTEIGDLSTLMALDVSINQLTSLPTEIGDLSALMTLDVSKNQLTSLPTELGNLGSLYQLNLYDNLLPNNYQTVLNTLGFGFTVYYEDQRQLDLKNNVPVYKILSESDLTAIDLFNSVELSDLSPLSSSHNFILTNYVDENNQPVNIADYVSNGKVIKEGKLRAQIRSTGSGLFPNNSEHALTTSQIQLEFELNHYTLTFDLNGGKGTPPAAQSLIPGELASSVDNPTKVGSIFKGWNTAPDGSGSTWDFKNSKMPATDITLYAQWEDDSNSNVTNGIPPVDTNSSLPKTGDSSNMVVFSILLITAGITLVLLKKKRAHIE